MITVFAWKPKYFSHFSANQIACSKFKCKHRPDIDEMNMKVVLLLVFFVFVLDTAYAPYPTVIRPFVPGIQQREVLIKAYFRQGYAYKDIVLFLATMHGIYIGVDRLKRILARLGLRRRNVLDEESARRVLEAVRSEIVESGKFPDCWFATSNLHISYR